jgi:hypothetical protein
MESASQGIFQCFDTTLAAITPEVLGLWETVPTPSSQALAFGTAIDSLVQPLLWRADLPAELRLAHAHLADAETRVHTSQTALAGATHRLEGFLEARQAGMAFGLPAGDRATGQPEAALAGLLEEIQAGRGTVSFGVGAWLGGGWAQATQQLQAVVTRLRHLVSDYVWVETRVHEELLGQTTVGWSGGVQTVWRRGLTADEVMLHQRTLALALQSRHTMLQTLVLATRCAGRLASLSLLLSTPGGVLLALPAAWKFINEVLAEVGRARSQTSEVHDG